MRRLGARLCGHDLVLDLVHLAVGLFDLVLETATFVWLASNNQIHTGDVHIHLLVDKVQTALDCAVRLKLFLLQQNRANELVDRLAVLEVLEFLSS